MYHPGQKLSQEERNHILHRLHTENYRGLVSDLAKQYGVSQGRISQLKSKYILHPIPEKSLDQEWVSVEEAARYLHCTNQTVREWIYSGKLEAKKLQKKGKWFAYRVKASDLSQSKTEE